MSKYLLVIWIIGTPNPVAVVDFSSGPLCLEKEITINEYHTEYKAECRLRDKETI